MRGRDDGGQGQKRRDARRRTGHREGQGRAGRHALLHEALQKRDDTAAAGGQDPTSRHERLDDRSQDGVQGDVETDELEHLPAILGEPLGARRWALLGLRRNRRAGRGPNLLVSTA
jgi:hypothetical protein